MIQGFSHIGIGVSDLDASIRFYSDVFGFSELYRLDFNANEVAATMEQEGAFRSAMLLRGDVRIELLQWVDVPTSGGGKKPMTERISMSWNTFSSRVASRPATAITSIKASQPDIHSAAFGFEGMFCMGRQGRG